MIPVLVVAAVLVLGVGAGWVRAEVARRRVAAEAEAAAARVRALEAELGTARSGLEARQAELEAARAASAEADAARHAATADAEAARRDAEQAAQAARAAGVPWVEAVWALERLRAERTWRTVAAGDEAAPAGTSPLEVLARALDVELQWMRDVVGTPGRMVTAVPDAGGAGAGPAALVVLHLAQEVLDVLGKRCEALEVGLTAPDDRLEVVVSAVEVEQPWDPDGRVARLGDSVAGVDARVAVDDDGEAVVVRLSVPVPA